jgi:putative endonuclease
MEVSQAAWFVYLLQCRDSTLYCGIAKNLEKRLAEHNSADKGAKYTRGRRPVRLVYAEEAASRAKAAQREGRIKRLTRAQKMALIQDGTSPQ